MSDLNRMNELVEKRDDIRRRLEQEALDTMAGPVVECEGEFDAAPSNPLIDDEVEGYKGPMRKFDTGATRNVDDDNLDYEGFLSPLVLERFAQYMHSHRRQADGTVRASDNWQKGIPFDSYMKSGFRHFMDWWMTHRGLEARDDVETALCALLFNVQGYLHEYLKAK